MSNPLFFSLATAAAAALIALAAVFPQGLGARSPGTFGHAPAPREAAAPPAAKANLRGRL